MAFSTQKDFLKVAFLNNRLHPGCLREERVKLKSYDSCTDSRAWDMNKNKQALFLADLVACRNYIDDKHVGVESGTGTGMGRMVGMDRKGEGGEGQYLFDDKGERDSLLVYATEKLKDIDNMVTENDNLRGQLEMSNEKLAILEDENKKIKRILATKTDPSLLSPYHKKIRQLRAQGKITPEDEKELFEMQKYLECKDKEYKVLQAENNSLKQLVEKLAGRAKLNKIPATKETSTDVKYLQSVVNDLREEVGILRGMENDIAQIKSDSKYLKSKYDALSAGEKKKRLNQDAEKMGIIIDERNNLRDQLSKMIGIEDKIAVLRKRALQADRLEKELKDLKSKLNDLQQESEHAVDAINNLSKERDNIIYGLETDVKTLESCKAERDCLKKRCLQFEVQFNEMQKAMEEVDAFRKQNQELCGAIRDAHNKLRKMQCLEQELLNTKKQLDQSEHDYERQMNQLLDVIEELEAQKCFCYCGDQAGKSHAKKDGHIQDLIRASKLTLEQAQKEFSSSVSSSLHELKGMKESKTILQPNKVKPTSKWYDPNGFYDAGQVKNIIAQEKQKWAKGKPSLENELKNKTDLYNKAKDDYEKKVEELNKNKEAHAEEIAALNSGVEEQKQLLASAKTELEQYRNELNSCTEKSQALESDNKSLQDEIGNLRNGNTELSKQLKDKENEVADINSKIGDLEKQLAACQDEIKNSSEQDSRLQGELGNMKKSFDDCSAELNKLKSEKDSFNEALSKKDDEIKIALNQLDKSKADLDALRKELQDKIKNSSDQDSRLQGELGNMKKSFDDCSAELSKIKSEKDEALSKKEDEIKNALSQLDKSKADLDALRKELQDKIKNSSDQDSRLQGELGNMKKSFDDCSAELSKIKSEKDEALSKKDDEIKNALSQLDKSKADLDASRKELQDKINSLMSEKKALEDQVAAGKADLEKLGKLAADIEAEREKNKKLEAIAQDFENNLNEMSKTVTAPPAGGERQVQQAMDQLKSQLKRETSKVNDLENQLAKCKQALAEAQGAKGTVGGGRGGGVDAPIKEVENKPIGNENTSSLTKIQSIYDNQLKDLIRNHDKEIEALKLANQALRDSLMNLKQGFGGTGEGFGITELQNQLEELKKGICECGKKKKLCPMTKLQEICVKIVEQGIECLNIKELKYIHSEVYKAGLKLITGLIGGDKQQRCCKCTGFSCCLPNIPKDSEKKLLNRITCLENDVENANKILQHLKQCSDKKKAVAKTSYSAERYNTCRVNDEINEFLKRAKSDKKDVCEVTELYRKCKKSASRRGCGSSRDCN